MRQKDRISLLEGLGRYILEELEGEGSPEWNATLQRAYIENKWFTIENTRQAMKAVATRMLQPELLEAWVAPYELSDPMHPDITVGIVMAGNIPMVGFSDWLAVFVAGQRAKIKLSEKDRVLLPFLVNKLGEWEHESREYTIFCTEHEALKGFDAVIATGSNNTARYFREYFAKYPHIIRANRNAVAVLDGTETAADFFALGTDIFSYFGLGCRNVSKIYVPRNYTFDPLLEVLHEYRELANHDKYRNNFDYNMTLFLLNSMPHLINGCIILREDASLTSRIASVHYEYYDSLEAVSKELEARKEEIQCVVSKSPLQNITALPFGQSQTPGLTDYPDGVDVLAFLKSLKGSLN